VIQKREELLLTTPGEFSTRYRIDIRTLSEAEAVDPKNKTVHIRNLATGETYTETYDRLILSPGAEPLRPPIPGVDLDRIFILRNIPDTDRIKIYVDQVKPESAVVVGGGFIGLETAENLVFRGVKTTIVEMLDQVMPPLDYEMAAPVRDHLTENGVTSRLSTTVTTFSARDDRIAVSTDAGEELICDMVVLAVGVRPEIKLAKNAGLTIGDTGGIHVDGTMRTSDPNIYAVGDAVEVTDMITEQPTLTPLAGPANKQGRIAADNALGRRTLFKGTLGTSVVKVFKLTAASTGAGEKRLQASNLPYKVSYTHSGSHAGYYPGAEMMAVKLLFSPGTGRILGCQIIGVKGVDKRIDVIAAAIRGRLTVFDLEELELAYAPPYSSAKDPVNIAGFVASNILKGDIDIVTRKDPAPDTTDHVYIDLREAIELKLSGTVDGALHIPLHQLRDRLSDLDREKTHILFCAVGMRAYIAHRILIQHGFRSRVFSGGFFTYRSTHPA